MRQKSLQVSLHKVPSASFSESSIQVNVTKYVVDQKQPEGLQCLSFHELPFVVQYHRKEFK